ncbi:lef-8 [Agrotis segetum granulovirus]|uniref:Lef-8 n=2 Tax=Agrotis segetum granulosis virus TaxID=10464 RepID=A0A0H4BMH8_GVAS|nr:lef-8 [Agrotis segetum granulovirus]AKN63408.1 lef-8 [Agrotis segetum granulovirus]
MGVLDDFNSLYDLLRSYNLEFHLSCQNLDKTTSLRQLQDKKTYFCCGISKELKKCVLHNCIVVVIGTLLDKEFRCHEDDYGFAGTFIIDGRHFSFPNIMMNNNVLLHNFFDKQYARDKNMRRMFLYGNFDDEKSVNRAIQLVYDRKEDVLYVRDVYAKDYIVDDGINEVLKEYLKCSGKWHEMDFVFDFEDYDEIFNSLKQIMSVDIDYQIDSLSNKIIYKHSYLLLLTYSSLLNKIKNLTENGLGVRKKKLNMGILFPLESKKCSDTIISGRLIQSVSKTLSKQRKNDQEYNSNNNNLEIFPLQHRIGNEVLRIINENLQQDMLKHTSDFVKFVDSFFHGEMTVAGKKFFLCHNVVLPDVNYKRASALFRQLIEEKFFFTKNDANGGSQKSFETYFELQGDINNKKVLNYAKEAPLVYLVSFNNRPTKYYCKRSDLYCVYYILKRNYSPIEIKVSNGILFVNHHEGMVMLKKLVRIHGTTIINTLQTPYEYHNKNSVVASSNNILEFYQENLSTTSCLMSTMVLNYYKDYLHIFNTIPVAKLIVSLTNLKNGMVVHTLDNQNVIQPLGNSVRVDPSIYHNDRMFILWTLIRDSGLKTAEDPYIPHNSLPIRIFHNKVNKVKGKLDCCGPYENVLIEYKASSHNNIIDVEGWNRLCLFGTLVCGVKMNWNYDGKKYKIEYCPSKSYHVYKFYMYFRKVRGQKVETVNSEMFYNDDGTVTVKLTLVYSVSDLEGLKICGVHGQKGILNSSEDLSRFKADSDSSIHAQICLSPISYISRQTNMVGMRTEKCTIDGKCYPLVLIPYMFFNNTPDNIYKEFIGKNITGYEKLEGTRLDQWSINQSFMGNRLAEGLHCVRNGTNTPHPSGQYNIFKSLIHCNNISIST